MKHVVIISGEDYAYNTLKINDNINLDEKRREFYKWKKEVRTKNLKFFKWFTFSEYLIYKKYAVEDHDIDVWEE